jgi:predicted ATPase
MTALVSRSVVLVTGISGTGRSAALAHLRRRGHRVVDTDDPGWIVHVEAPQGIEPMWDFERVRALVDGHRVGRPARPEEAKKINQPSPASTDGRSSTSRKNTRSVCASR